MSFYDAIRVGASGATGDFEVQRSLRFNDGDDTYLQRTVSSTSNRKTFTISAWIKPSETDSRFWFGVTDTSGYEFFYIGINSFYRLVIFDYDYPVQNVGLTTNRLFRDPSAWYHIVVAFDTTQATNTNRVKLYVNGVQETSWYNEAYPAQNLDTFVNHTTFPVYIGKLGWGGGKYHGYMAEYNFIDGQQLTPSSFGETNSETGQWNPIDTSGLTFGTNGFRLKFADNSGTTATTLGKDTSGNGNNFTPNNFSVSAGVGNDSLEDTPTNNFATLNALKKPTNGAISNGNLDGSGNASAWVSFFSTILVSSGKWFCEVKVNATRVGVGIAKDGADENSYLGSAADTYAYYDLNGKWNNNSNSSYGATYTTNDIIGIALDMDAGTLIFYKNGTSQGTAFTGLSGEFALGFSVYGGSANASINYGQRAFDYTVPAGYKALNSANLPDPSILLPNKHFNTLIWDGNSTQDRDISGLDFQPDWVWIKARNGGTYGGGLYYHHVVWDSLRGVGSNTIGSASRKELTVNEDYQEGRGANYTDYYGHVSAFNSDGFELDHVTGEPPLYVNRNTNTYVGWSWNAGETDGATYRVVVVSDSGNKYRFRNSANTATFAQSAVTLNLAEGGTYIFNMDDSTNASHPFSIGTAANGTVYTTGITYFLDGVSKTYSEYTSGFAAATTRRLHITVPASAPQLYYWCSAHSGMGGAINTNTTLGSSNFDGSIQTTVKVNATAGFSIISYTGTGSDGTLGHGLGVAPSIYIVKRRNSTKDWYVQIGNLSGIDLGRFLKLNKTDGLNFASDVFAASADTSTVLNTKSDSATNGSSDTYIAYCFSSVKGYSKFGKYTGNGSTDGTFIFLGFRPAWFLLKRSDTSASWLLYDNKRDPDNRVAQGLFPNTSGVETEQTGGFVDFVSNGVKLKEDGSAMNASGGTYIYLAFAESPFKNSRAR